jgi:hypothetical protein
MTDPATDATDAPATAAPATAAPATADREFFRIPAARFEYLVERIAKLLRRRSKLLKSGALADTAPISVEKVSTDIEPPLCRWCERLEAQHYSDGRCYQGMAEMFSPGVERVYFICRVTGPAPVLEGFEFIATLQHEDVGTILRTVPTAKIAEGELDRFRQVKPHCEHCQVRRFRKDSFVVREVETGCTIQVGRTCLGKYIGGGASPTAIAALAELLITVREAGFEEEGYGWGSSGETVASLPQFLTYVAASVRLTGWTSRGAARDDDTRIATVDHVWSVLFPGRDRISQKLASEFAQNMTDADRQTAIGSLNFAGEKLLTSDRLSDYEHNMRIALSCEAVNRKRAGIVASVIAWYERAVGKAVAKKAELTGSTHVGSVGDRCEFRVTLNRVFDTENDFGVSHGHFFLDADGNVLVWWTGTKRLDVGTVYELRGTVKRHSEYKGTKQTLLSRCKAVSVANCQNDKVS